MTYGSAYYSVLQRQDNKTGESHNVSPWPVYLGGAESDELRYRFGWTHPVLFSPVASKASCSSRRRSSSRAPIAACIGR